MPNATQCIEIIAAFAMLVAVIGIIINRESLGKGYGVRVIQFVAVAAMFPTILILSLEKILDGCSVAAIIGGLVGYLFANIAEFDKKKDTKDT